MQLRKSIGKKTLLMLTVNAILGTGIFFLPAIGIGYSGASSIVAWAVMSVVAIIISLYFAELVSIFPKSGGAYEFVKNAFGRSTGFIFGWMSWIVANVTIAMLIVGSVLYILPGFHFAVKLIFALAFIIGFNLVSYRGIDLSAKMLLFFGIMTVLTLAAIIIPGTASADLSLFSTIFAAPLPLILLTVYFIAETFFGWETTTYLSEEIKDARKVLPKMLVIATVIIAVISLLIVFVAIGNTRPAEFAAQEAPLAFLAEKFFGGTAGKIFALLIFIPLIGTAASWIVSSPRLLFAMSRDKIMVPRFSRLHKKYKTPHNAILFQTAVTSIITLMAFGNYLFLLSVLVPLVIIMYSIVMLSVVKLRIDYPRMKRHFSAPFPKAGPLAVIAFNLMLLYFWLSQTPSSLPVFLMGVMLIVVGAPLYVLIRLQTDKRFVEGFYDHIAFIWDRLFHIWYGEKEASNIVKFLRLKHNSSALDFGCGSGNTTLEISKKMAHGTVVAVDLSEKQLQHAAKKIRAFNLNNVIFVKGTIRFPQKSFDAVTAIGVLEHFNRPRPHIVRLIRLLKPGGRFYFLSFGKSFWIPGPEFLKTDEIILKMFKGMKVDVKIRRKKMKFTEYVSIYGVKK